MALDSGACPALAPNGDFKLICWRTPGAAGRWLGFTRSRIATWPEFRQSPVSGPERLAHRRHHQEVTQMLKRLAAIGFIFCCTAAAWFILAGVTTSRTYSADQHLREQIERIWGAPQVQQSPGVTWTERVVRQVEGTVDGKSAVRTVEDLVVHSIPLDASDIDVALRLEHRQKGLLWYATYAVDFTAAYTIVNS